MKNCLASLAVAALACGQALSGAPLYSLVAGVDKFDGSAAAWQLLQTNGFVVAEPTFAHIYEPYLDSPLPVYITPDSAWHTYRLLLDYGISQADLAQSATLAKFSRRLESTAREESQIEGADFAVLASYAAIGLALQDEDFAAALPEGKRKIVDALHSGTGTVETGLGFPLAAAAFKAPSTGAPAAPELAAWFAARQWYATVDFRLSDPRETRLALCLAWLIQRDSELSKEWSDLADFDDALVSPAVGSVHEYAQAEKGLDPSGIKIHLDTLRASLEETLPAPTINDQFLIADDASHFAAVTRGFRLLPSREVPLRDGPDGVPKSMSGPPPDSIMSRSLGLLTNLSEPLPDNAAPAFRSTAWANLQLWTQLGASAELRAAGAAQPKPAPIPPDLSEKPSGVVAPYPQFFAGLRDISRRATTLLRHAGADASFEKLMGDFGGMCDRLSALAQKQRDGAELTSDEARWIRGYGVTLQSFHLANGDSDDAEFPVISRLSSDPAAKTAPYAWVAQPQALYVILPSHGRLQLWYCGAVLSFRQCVRAEDALNPQGDAPPAPDFTRTFRAEKSTADLLAELDTFNPEHEGFGDEQSLVQQLDGRLSDADVPELIRIFADNDTPAAAGPSPLAGLIGKLNWKPFQTELLLLMETNEAFFQPVAAILNQRPEAIDSGWLCANFERQRPMVRALYCRLLCQGESSGQISSTLYGALRDRDDDVRWSAIIALRKLKITNDQAVAALADRLTDTNEYVAAAAARALGKLRVAAAAPVMFTNLQARLAAKPSSENRPGSRLDFFRQPAVFAGDPDAQEDQFAQLSMRRGMGDFGPHQLGATAVDALVQALGDLNYQPAMNICFTLLQGDYAGSAARALDQLAPARLLTQLIDLATDSRKEPKDRDRALQLLMQCSPSRAGAIRLAPLLDDTTEIRMDMAGPGRHELMWRLCDRAAAVVAHLLDKPVNRLLPMPVRPANNAPEQVRQWLREASGN